MKTYKNVEKQEREGHYFELINAPYDQKIAIAKKRIEEFILFIYDQVDKKIIENKPIIVSFSGGKDSTVLFDLVCKTYQEMLDNNMLSSYIYIYIARLCIWSNISRYSIIHKIFC